MKPIVPLFLAGLFSMTACSQKLKPEAAHQVTIINLDEKRHDVRTIEIQLKIIYCNTWYDQDPSLKDHFIPFVRNLNKGPDSTLFVFDFMNTRIVQLSCEGKYMRSIGGPGKGPGEFFDASEHTFQTNQYLYIADNSGLRLQLFDRNGRYVRGINNARADGGRFAVSDYGNIITKPSDADDPEMKYMLFMEDSLGNGISKIGAIAKDDDFVVKKIRANFKDREPYQIVAGPGHEFIFCFFMFYPKIWIYDYTGLWVEEILFESEAIRNALMESKKYLKDKKANFGGLLFFRDPILLQNGDVLVTLATQGPIRLARKAGKTAMVNKYNITRSDSSEASKALQYVQLKPIGTLWFAYDIDSIFKMEYHGLNN